MPLNKRVIRSFKKSSIIIRQKGRLAGESVLHCDCSSEEISRTLKKALCLTFKETIKTAKNPYGTAGAAKRSIAILKLKPLGGTIMTSFLTFPGTPKPTRFRRMKFTTIFRLCADSHNHVTTDINLGAVSATFQTHTK
jgi:hypothetical protein